MIMRINKMMAAAFLLLVSMGAAASCQGNAPAPNISVAGHESVFKTVSTTFSSGTVDTTTSTNVGPHCSIAIDPDDNYPAIAYYDLTNGNLMYAKWDGSDWDDKTTVDSTGDVGKYASLAFDSAGNPSIGYYRDDAGSVGALMWAYDDDDDGDWDEGGWPMQLAYNGTSDFGKYCSHKISGIYFAFAFYDDTDDNLIYLEYNTVTQHISPVDADTSGDVGQYCSLEFDYGTPAISYYDATNGNLKYATEDSPYWDAQPVDTEGNVGQYTSLDFDSNRQPSIAYYDVDNEDAKWARWDSEEEEWVCVTLVDDGGEKWGQHISHQWFGSTKCGFAFEAADGSSSWLEFVRWTPAGQDEYAADSTTDCGDFSSFAWVYLGANRGDAWIAHRCFSSSDKYLRYTFVDD